MLQRDMQLSAMYLVREHARCSQLG